MRVLLAFTLLSLVKIFSHLFYKFHHLPIEHSSIPWKKLRLVLLLNHTSLYEPLYIQLFPWKMLWHISRYMSAPGADKTMNRPLVGLFWRLMAPGMTSITRKKDQTWDNFLKTIHEQSIVFIAPEGRMKRPNGLDAEFKEMNIRGGISDIIYQLNDGYMLIGYSAGLHHVQAPGQFLPKIFKNIYLATECLDIKNYKSQFPLDSKEFKLAVVKDLTLRLKKHCPSLPQGIK